MEAGRVLGRQFLRSATSVAVTSTRCTLATAGGLVFIANSQDRMARAFDNMYQLIERMAEASKMIKVTLVKSTIGCKPEHRACVRGLGLRRIGGPQPEPGVRLEEPAPVTMDPNLTVGARTPSDGSNPV